MSHQLIRKHQSSENYEPPNQITWLVHKTSASHLQLVLWIARRRYAQTADDGVPHVPDWFWQLEEWCSKIQRATKSHIDPPSQKKTGRPIILEKRVLCTERDCTWIGDWLPL